MVVEDPRVGVNEEELGGATCQLHLIAALAVPPRVPLREPDVQLQRGLGLRGVRVRVRHRAHPLREPDV